jgi:hypothetical protein
MEKKSQVIPKIVDGDLYFRYALFLSTVDNVGLREVHIEGDEIVKKLIVPEFVENLAIELDIKLEKLVNVILKDFVLRMTAGNSKYEEGILKRINSLNPEDRKRVLKSILGE